MPLKVQCPTCQTEVEWSAQQQFKPFCSERCKMLDLGDWAAEKHAIPVEPDLDIQLLDEIGYDEPNFFKED
ncbi:DNA gyrase inhibitor YacG [Parashewanella tropica]|uniref:DNA gyrase inhibitor YacG n=1 Tax=Parashewanella tropica TaxID=2547970 RepID=UPI0010595ABA|nr:DNA gyrase inhibitor YacG [Parashewanella tropica]